MLKKKSIKSKLKIDTKRSVTELLTILGCVFVVAFTYSRGWNAYEYTVAFVTIMTGGKGMKILDTKLNAGKVK
jgi:hypothetical protein